MRRSTRRLRAVKSMIRYWIDAEFCARITYDDLGRVKQKSERVADRVWLTPTQCRQMLDAAMRHDRDTDGPGTPIAPYVLYTLLGGARVSEALALDWSHIDLKALNVNLEPVGEIEVPATISKTKTRRVIGLQETPSLRSTVRCTPTSERRQDSGRCGTSRAWLPSGVVVE